MSDSTDDLDVDEGTLGDESRLLALRERMSKFVEDHGGGNVRDVRRAVADGKPLSEIVLEDREDRL